jgi:alanine dehydrogenase
MRVEDAIFSYTHSASASNGTDTVHPSGCASSDLATITSQGNFAQLLTEQTIHHMEVM